jgi:hypothetical protein
MHFTQTRYPVQSINCILHLLILKCHQEKMSINRLVTNALCLLASVCSLQAASADKTAIWHKYEIPFASDREYENPIYDVSTFSVVFTSATGREKTVNGFWDGGKTWKVRFLPDETGEWSWESICSDRENSGLHGLTGRFSCVRGMEDLEIYRRGSIRHIPGKYFLTYDDGTPFFWMGCTAWNGAMKSTGADWDTYLRHRKERHYNLIQFVTTQWRGGDSNRDGDLAYTGSGRIEIHPRFFQKMDEKVDRINELGLVAAPVLLWALPFGDGRHLSPGYHLPVEEAVLLASYIVARYQGNQVIWVLGGDGRYFGEFEDRWKAIGQKVFEGIDHAPATLHPHGNSYIGDIYAGESWYSIMGYQSSHSYQQRTVDFINRKEIANDWARIRPMPHINMEPLYENIHDHQTPENVRNAIWWSLFATPVAGVTYGANGIWSWIEKDGDPILNHRQAPWTVSWKNSLELTVSLEMEYVYAFMDQFAWWEFIPDPGLLLEQPGDEQFDAFVGVLSNPDRSQVLVYIPKNGTVSIRNPFGYAYEARWFDPIRNEYASADVTSTPGVLSVYKEGDTGLILILTND